MKSVTSFTGLIAWKEAHKLVLMIYRTTRGFPSEERFGLMSQMRRASVSISSNIAEGFGRRTQKDKQHFYDISQCSLTEIQNQLLISRDVGYLPKEDFQQMATQTVTVSKLIYGIRKSARTY